VTIGNNTTLRSHIVVDGHASIGQDCDVFPFVTLGVQSQDLKYVPGTVTYVRIGHRNIIRQVVVSADSVRPARADFFRSCPNVAN